MNSNDMKATNDTMLKGDIDDSNGYITTTKNTEKKRQTVKSATTDYSFEELRTYRYRWKIASFERNELSSSST